MISGSLCIFNDLDFCHSAREPGKLYSLRSSPVSRVQVIMGKAATRRRASGREKYLPEFWRPFWSRQCELRGPVTEYVTGPPQMIVALGSSLVMPKSGIEPNLFRLHALGLSAAAIPGPSAFGVAGQWATMVNYFWTGITQWKTLRFIQS
jgi:hypothetical protein